MIDFGKIMTAIDAIRGGTNEQIETQEWEIALEMVQGRAPKWYGVVYWTPADVQEKYSEGDPMTDEEAEKWLLEYEDDISENMIMTGYETIQDKFIYS
jgi:hypothetical protein